MTFTPSWLTKIWGRYGIRRKLIIVENDTPPTHLSTRNLYLAREDDEDWAVAFNCPCGCNARLELQLLEEISPSWQITISNGKYPTLHPSIWKKEGCKSHFWIRNGKIHWC